jgi:hypothetical protein
MFGLMKYDRVEWNEVEYSKISLFGFVKNEWRDMEHEELISFHFNEYFQNINFL